MTMKGSMVLTPAVVEPAREDIWSTTDNPSMDWGKGTCRKDDFSWVWFCECKRVSLLQRDCAPKPFGLTCQCLLLILKVSSKNVSSTIEQKMWHLVAQSQLMLRAGGGVA